MDGQMGLAGVWYWILALLLWLYVFTDGFDLGVGVLCLLTRDEARRGAMIETIEGVWHANQTWLVMLGGVLFGAFPLVYGTVLAVLYLPAGLLLFAFMARGIGLEYRAEAARKGPWSALFGWGSLAVIVAHGLLLGGILQGMRFSGLQYLDGAFDWLSPFTLLVCLTLVCLYALLGAAWLVLRTEGEVQEAARRFGLRFGLGAAAALVLVVAAIALTPTLGHLAGRPGTGGLGRGFVGAILAAMVFAGLALRSLIKGADGQPLLYCAGLLLCVFLAFGGSLYPVVVPPGLTAAKAAAPADMLRIMLWVIGGLLPVLLLYNAYQYRVFGGKSISNDEADPS
jgi:cytochrome bd ubiquinol oxidase subunit II